MNVNLDLLMAKARKDYGERSFIRASEVSRSINMPRISTGILVMDYETGGGIPVGRTSMIYGKKSSGKSSLIAKIATNAQRLCRKCYCPTLTEEKEVSKKVIEKEASGKMVEVARKWKKHVPFDCINKCRVLSDLADPKSAKIWPGRMNIIWIDAEGTFSPDFYTNFGMDCEEIYLITCESGEQAVDLADAAIQTGECDLLFVDSVAHLVPIKEREASAEDAQMALQARLINRAMRDWTASLNSLAAKGQSDCTIVLINQLRQTLGLFPTDVRPGGHGQEYATSLDIRLWQKKCEFDTNGRPLWQETQFSIEKNKTGPPKMEGHYKMCLLEHPDRKQGDTWDDEAVFDTAKANDFLIKKDGKVHVFDRKFETEMDVRVELLKRDEFYHTLRSRILDLMIGRPSDGKIQEKKKKE